MMTKSLPYLPEGRGIAFVSEKNEFMALARLVAQRLSTDRNHPTGAVVVRRGAVLGSGANHSFFHQTVGCVRKGLRHFFSIPSGKGYGLCYGCSPKFHAEQSAIRDAQKNGHHLEGADLYLWGHWWCCESCWAKMMEVGIENVFLIEGAREQFSQ